MTLTSLTSLDQVLAALPSRGLVAIVGPPGAGKSTIAEALVARLPDAALLPMDGFHLPQVELRRLGRRERMGAPDTFDVGGFLTVLRALRAGRTPGTSGTPGTFRNDGDPVIAPGFDRAIEAPVPGAITISPSFWKVIIEGNYLLLDSGGWEAAAPLFDSTFFVEVDQDIRLERLIARHVRFGKSPADARAWALGPDESNALLIEATASRADYRIRL